MAVSPFSAAKFLGKSSDWSLSNLELQKLLYIAHMFHLGRTDEALIHGHFEAWEYGPVHPPLYHKAKIFGASPVKNIFHSTKNLGDGPEKDILDEVATTLSDAVPGRLVAITHWENGAWAKHYRSGVRGIFIPNEDIRKEYWDRAHDLQATQAGT